MADGTDDRRRRKTIGIPSRYGTEVGSNSWLLLRFVAREATSRQRFHSRPRLACRSVPLTFAGQVK